MSTYIVVTESMFTIEAKSKREAEEEALGSIRNDDNSEVVSCQKI